MSSQNSSETLPLSSKARRTPEQPISYLIVAIEQILPGIERLAGVVMQQLALRTPQRELEPTAAGMAG